MNRALEASEGNGRALNLAKTMAACKLVWILSVLVVVECGQHPQHDSVTKTVQQNYANHVRDEEIAGEAAKLIRNVFDNGNLRVEDKVNELRKYHNKGLTIQLYGCGQSTVIDWVIMCSLDLDRCDPLVLERREGPAWCPRYRYFSDYCYESLITQCRNNVGDVSLYRSRRMNKVDKKLMTDLLTFYQLVEAKNESAIEPTKELVAAAYKRMKETKAKSYWSGMDDESSLEFLGETKLAADIFSRTHDLLLLLSNGGEEKLELPNDALLNQWRKAGAIAKIFSRQVSPEIEKKLWGSRRTTYV